jgi:Bacterial Ig-like domain (group 3)/FG-GAP-like repeat
MGILVADFQRAGAKSGPGPEAFSLNRFISALLSLAFLSTVPALAQAPGTGQADVTLSPQQNPTAVGLTLSGAVQGVPVEGTTVAPAPHGTLTFFDGGTALNPAGASLSSSPGFVASTFAQTFGMTTPWTRGVLGDFNGDGRPDLVLYGVGGPPSPSLGLQVFVSNGDVPPSPNGPISYVTLPAQSLPMPSLPASPGDVAVIDIDGDGHLDLLIGNTVAYGKGDGTFSRVAVLPVLATGFSQAYAIDVNGDGKLDIVAVNTPPAPTTNPGTVQFMFTVFRNDGGGTFTSLGTFPLAPSFQTGGLCCAYYNIFGLSFADLNGDGKVDVLSQSNAVAETNTAAANQLNVMLNNGDGTFGTIKSVDALGITPYGVAFGDINGDGKQDLLLAFSNIDGTNFLGSALGNGDGTFGAFVQLTLINFITVGVGNPQIQLNDFNADGKLDAVLGSGELALGNGDGTFTLSTPLFPQPADPQTPISYPLLQASLFPNSSPSLVYLNFTSGANAVFTPFLNSDASITAALAAGTHTLTAHYSGDSNYASAVSPAVTITVAPAVTTTTLASSANPVSAGQNVTFTATLANTSPGVSGTVTFKNGSTTLGTAAVTQGSAAFTTSFPSGGNQIITAAYGGDANDAASSATLNQAVEALITVGSGSGPAALTVASGQSVSTTLSVNAITGFSGQVALSCTGLPALASCSFSPASVAVSATAAASSMLTVSTGAANTAAAQEPAIPRTTIALACGLPLLGLLALLPVARGRRLLLCLGFALFVSVTSLTGCGGGGQSAQSTGAKTVPGSYTFNVVATSGAVTSTVSYSLTVQ